VEREVSSIITFYSFKGGVGRTMALANIAMLLTQRGLKVLAIDWDLEAPGLERYFESYNRKSAKEQEGVGLLDLLIQARAASSPSDWPNWRDFVTTVETPAGDLSTILAGRRDETYTANLESFDWAEFFDHHDGGEFFEMLREQWRSTYEIVLIDSRTGLTDAGGVCTIQMPDVLAVVFTANYQSLYGARDAIKMAQDARQKLEYDRMPLLVLPVPSRWDGRAEVDESREWLQRFADTLGHCYNSWLPQEYAPSQMLERTKIPHVPRFSFGEKLPALTHGTSDPELPGYAYDAYASLIEAEFKDAGRLLGPPLERTRKPAVLTPPKDEYEFDLYISYARGGTTSLWLRNHFLPMISAELELSMGEPCRIFADISDVATGSDWPLRLNAALVRSRCLLALLTSSYFNSEWCLRELLTFVDREKRTGARAHLLVPAIAHDGESFPSYIKERQSFDFRRYLITAPAFSTTASFVDFELMVRRLAEQLAVSIRSAPPYDPAWESVRISVPKTKRPSLPRLDNAS
jgi:Mrp family chromosome partitioning ATPase